MADTKKISLNTATVREQWDLAQCIDGCVRHGFAGIDPWRDKLAELGVEEAARRIKDAGLDVTGLCRGGMFTATDEAGRQWSQSQPVRFQCLVGGRRSDSRRDHRGH